MRMRMMRLAVAIGVLWATPAATGQVAPVAGEYPRGGRDPFVPPAALYSGQSLPSISVTVIGVDSHDPRRPMAVLRLDSRPPVRKVVRPGDRVGEYRVLRIGPGGVRVAAPSFGGTTVMDLTVRDSSSSFR